MKKILMIAFQYPPFTGSSAVERILNFSKYLPAAGWQPIILTANPMAYQATSNKRIEKIPKNVLIKRTFALDASKHLSIAGRYLTCTDLPDRWSSWWFSAVPVGLYLIYKYRPRLLCSTYPILTANLIGLTLHRLTGIPWVADLRDPIIDEYPGDLARKRYKMYRWIEEATVRQCARAILTAPNALEMYSKRYSDIPPSRWKIIGNGYDETDFVEAEKKFSTEPKPSLDKPTVLLHAGFLYPEDRDPNAFFTVLAALRERKTISSSTLRIIFRGAGTENHYNKLINKYGIGDIVSFKPSIPHQEALIEMMNSDGLLIFQNSYCNRQIPAKVYEYLRAQRPIFAMIGLEGDTARLLKEAGINTIATLESKDEIMKGFLDFLSRVREGNAPIANSSEIKKHNRESRTIEFAKVLDELYIK